MLEQKRLQIKGRGQRSSVSAEVYGEFNKKAEFNPRVISKTEEQRQRILNKIGESFLFSSLEQKEMNTVLGAFEEKKITSGETVISQGDQGDVLYFIEEGELDCYKTFKKEEGDVWLKLYKPGEAFGELALLYNAPRAATIKSKTDCILWALDRETFKNIVQDAAV
jgi:cAMP-dependent protein kinase regulator